ncbi:MAG: gluconolaconase [Candidatus Aminicenantes bacterium RBG_16_63_16]|nr:MAG: gluconolaconase [Candidatus Aminicenantes bacterium RBG_16_63_16]
MLKYRNRRYAALPAVILFAGIALGLGSACAKKPDWAAKNRELVKQKNIATRDRADIPSVKLKSNLEPGVVGKLAEIPVTKVAPGVSARLYWGKGNLVALLTMDPNAGIPLEALPSERIMVVMKGDVEQSVEGNRLAMSALPRETPDGTHGGTPKNEFILLEKGTRCATKAGPAGAELIAVDWPPRADLLARARVKARQAGLDKGFFPLEPTVDPGIVYDLYDVQFTELSPGANSRLISGRGAQLSFLSMNPDVVFPDHRHPEEQLMVVFRGSIDEVILDRVVRMEKGDVLRLPGDMVHGGIVSELGCDVLDVFWPPRTDYAEKTEARLQAYRAIIPEEAAVELVVDGAAQGPGLVFTEGPKWLGGRLYLSSMYFDEKWAGDPARSAVVELSPDGNYRYVSKGKMQSNGLMPLANGNLAVCDMFGHRVVEMTTGGQIVRTLAGAYGGRPLDGPNDLVVDAKGGLYITDPQFTPDAKKNQPGRAVYYLNPAGRLLRVIEPNAFAMPNGVLLSPDGKTLYVNNTYDSEKFWNIDTDKENYVWAYDVNADGTLANGRKFAELYLTPEVLDRQGRSTGADGMTIDERGNIYVATYAGLQIFNPKGGFVGIVNLPVFPVSCCFGGDDMKTLYMACYNRVYRIRTNVKGLSYPPKAV